MRKILASIFFVLPLIFLAYKPAFAEGEFLTTTNTTYDVQTSGQTIVTHNVTLENLFTDLYATTYGLSLNQPDITNIKATDKTGNLPTEISRNNDVTSIKINFNDVVVGRGEKRNFSISYSDPSIATHAGQVWEIVIPGKETSETDKFSNISLKVPTTFGDEAYISPDPSSRSTENGKFEYEFNNLSTDSPITAAFGEFQVFSFELIYHLENPLNKPAYTEIALPPDTSYQKINITEIDPKPDEVNIDTDGNWIAKYVMEPRERFDVTASGYAQMFSFPIRGDYPDKQTLEDSLKPTQYWQSDDPKIIELAQRLKTPEAIYDYVTKTLSYDYDRVKPNVSRLGALEALDNPLTAICMEYTDLFVAIARAAGIPAREINGYAYTENPELQPLSLVADVLHSWAEYWDEEKQMWIQVDPTWGSTSGVDFFNKLDLRHLTFVIHGKDAIEPYPPGSYKLGPNPQKDVFVNFSQLPEDLVKSKLEIAVDDFNVVATNSGPQAMHHPRVEVYFDDLLAQTFESENLPPFGQLKFSINVPHGFLGKDMPQNVVLVSADERIVIPTNRQNVIISQTAIILAVILLILVAVLLIVKFHARLPNIKSIFKRTP